MAGPPYGEEAEGNPAWPRRLVPRKRRTQRKPQGGLQCRLAVIKSRGTQGASPDGGRWNEDCPGLGEQHRSRPEHRSSVRARLWRPGGVWWSAGAAELMTSAKARSHWHVLGLRLNVPLWATIPPPVTGKEPSAECGDTSGCAVLLAALVCFGSLLCTARATAGRHLPDATKQPWTRAISTPQWGPR